MKATKDENFQRKTNLDIQQDEEISYRMTVTSQTGSDLDHEGNKILLKDSQNKIIFLSKVSLVFLAYFLFINFELYIIKKNTDSARLQYIHYKLDILLYIFIIVSLTIKIIFSIFGEIIRKLAPTVFVIDFYFTYMIVLGLYFKYSASGIYHSSNSSNVIDLIAFVMLFIFIGFFISTIFNDQNKVYNPILGIALMLLFQIGAVFLHKQYNQVVPLSSTLYVKTTAILFFINIYIALNSYLIVNYRTSKYYESDIFYCSISYWGDWINNIWIDLVKTNQQLVDENNQAYLENKKTLKLELSQELRQKIREIEVSANKPRKQTNIKVRVKKLKEFN